MTDKGNSLGLLWRHRRLLVSLNRAHLPIRARWPKWAICQSWLQWWERRHTTVSTEWTGNHLSPASSYPHSSSPGACW